MKNGTYMLTPILENLIESTEKNKPTYLIEKFNKRFYVKWTKFTSKNPFWKVYSMKNKLSP